MSVCMVVKDEVEVALKHNGTSYVGIGWKPTEGIVRECNSEIPRYEPEGRPIAT